jgi:hypothetical protein
MMRRKALQMAWVILLLGCNASERSAVVSAHATRDGQPNLALGPTAEHAWLATRVGPRSDWPAVWTGYRIDDVTYYNTYVYDEESHYDRYGSVYHGTEMIETGVWLR